MLDKLKSEVKAPYVNGYLSTLGGPERASIMFTIALQPKEEWTNKILENSLYGKFSLGKDGQLEMHSGSYKLKKKFRKTVVKTPEMLVTKLNKWVEENK